MSGRLAGLRAAAFATLAMLVVEVVMGVAVSLDVALPAADHGLGAAAAVGAAIRHGPATLAVHAVLGLLLLVSAAVLLARAILARQGTAVAAGAVGLLATLAAAGSGAGFVASGDNPASMAMAVAAGIAMLAYGVVLFRVVPRP